MSNARATGWKVGKAAADLTAAYTGWETDDIPVGGKTFLVVAFGYTHVDATSFELVMHTHDGSGWVAGDAADVYQDDAPATRTFYQTFLVAGHDRVKIVAKRTGGGAGNQLSARYQGGE